MNYKMDKLVELTKFGYRDNKYNEFNRIMSLAKKIMESDYPNRIYDLIYSLGKPYQFEIINKCIKGNPLDLDSAFCIEHLFFKKSNDHFKLAKVDDSGHFVNYYTSNTEKKIHPSESLIFTFPWHENRLYNAFKNVGEKVGRTWEHDPLNHVVVLVVPLNIGYIRGGNHSTAMNVINNESPMIIKEELDLTPVYDEIFADGKYFRKIKDKSIVDKVASVEFAAIFEIGRLITLKS